MRAGGNPDFRGNGDAVNEALPAPEAGTAIGEKL